MTDVTIPADEYAALRRDAERYRLLRGMHWDTSPLCCVRNPRQAVKLGSDCPSGERLDTYIDAAMKENNP